MIYDYCRTHNVRVCLYIAYIACGSASLYIKTLYYFLSAAATVANIKICYDTKTPQIDIFGTRVICVFYSTQNFTSAGSHCDTVGSIERTVCDDSVDGL